MLVFQNILASIQLPSTAKEQLNPDAFSSGKQMSFITVKAVLPPGMKSRKVHYCFFKPSSTDVSGSSQTPKGLQFI